MLGRLFSIAALGAALTLSAAAQAADPTGVWINDKGDTKVRVSRCGAALCGTVAWLGKPTDASGQPKTDRHNPDVAKRHRRLIGLPVLLGMQPAGGDRWSGHIYNADDGKTYVSRVTLANANSMQVQGCVLGGLLCKSMTWTRTN
jgi:uncharacterized protein (DUF2147 family)